MVTGATSGIGQAVAKVLLEKGYTVYGLGRDFEKYPLMHDRFRPVVIDLENLNELEEKGHELAVRHDFSVIVHAAGWGAFDPLEEMDVRKISQMMDVNLKAPIILTSQFLRGMKRVRGHLFFITSIEAVRSSKFSAVYSASKSGLRAFSLALFEEVRKAGVKVTSLNPDMTQTPFFDSLRFREGEREASYLLPECLAGTIANILEMREGSVVSDITLRPQEFGITKKESGGKNR